MRIRVLLAFATVSCALAQSPPANPQSMASGEQQSAEVSSITPQAIAQHYVDYWNSGNFEVLKPYVALFYMTSHSHKVAADEKMLSRVVKSWRESIPDLQLKVEDTIVQGNKVVMRILMTGTYKKRIFPNTIQPIPEAPPRFIRANEILIFEIKDAKIREIWEEYDELALRAQMGGRWIASQELDAQQAKDYPSSTTPKDAKDEKK